MDKYDVQKMKGDIEAELKKLLSTESSLRLLVLADTFYLEELKIMAAALVPQITATNIVANVQVCTKLNLNLNIHTSSIELFSSFYIRAVIQQVLECLKC